jgi:iron-sulfur cluster assembly protein
MIANKDENYIGVKIGVKRSNIILIIITICYVMHYLLGGCNGYSYTMNYASLADEESKKFEVVKAHDITVLVEPAAIFYILGTQMDYEVCHDVKICNFNVSYYTYIVPLQETALSSEFTFNNPNSKGKCGCGESFNV